MPVREQVSDRSEPTGQWSETPSGEGRPVGVALAAEAVAQPEPEATPPGGQVASAGRLNGSVAGTFGLAPGWWPVAFSSEVDENPRAIRLGDGEIVLYREAAGAARAVLDRCPHRRLPLSMGRVVDAGLQCGYHGWTFDGTSGQCTLIPNFRPDEKPSSRIRIPAYPVREAEGFVFVWAGSGAADPDVSLLPPAGIAPEAESAASKTVVGRGAAEVRAPHSRLAEALLVNPGTALGLGWLLGSGYEVLGPQVEADGQSVAVRRLRLTFDLPRVQTFEPISSRAIEASATTSVATGATVVVAETPSGRGKVRLLVGLTPAGDYRTTVRWQIEAQGGKARLTVLACRLSAVSRRLTGRVVRALEEAADAAETVADAGVDRLRELRKDIAGKTIAGKEA